MSFRASQEVLGGGQAREENNKLQLKKKKIFQCPSIRKEGITRTKNKDIGWKYFLRTQNP